MGLDFGAALKEWRRTRRISQLDLGLSAGVSSRHISFLETGRSRPSRGMVLRLCDELEVPIAQRNRMLTAAGLSPAYAERDLSEEEMAPMREAVAWTLERHAPYPALAMDKHWRLVQANRSCATMLAGFGMQEGDSMLDMMTANPVVREALENYEEIAEHLLARLRVEAAHFGHDPVLETAIAQFEEIVGEQGGDPDGIRPAVIPAIYNLGGMRLSLFSTISQFGSTEDIALSELRIEMFFPADEATKAALEAMA
ncbi:Xre family transcriptional regulator [Shimia isoporae]|uniref:Xre family transcriptional regulator n=1 Tax=Shimia isoporae TaxID=647720 RepID=A0A4R1NLR0_9RHOB|nr:helix-turn-helix transcriptional regulator [Shimia isoporae]TCL09214.1 Xre family transcriptional regulator [Shimia isoporae]